MSTDHVKASKLAAKIKGLVYRGSSVLSGVFNARYGVLTADTFLTFKRDSDTEPTRSMPLFNGIKVSDPSPLDAMIREHKSAIRSLITRSFDRKPLHVVTVSWPRETPWGGDILLGFETEAQAKDWQKRFLECSEALVPGQPLNLEKLTIASREHSASGSPVATPSRKSLFGRNKPPKVGHTPSLKSGPEEGGPMPSKDGSKTPGQNPPSAIKRSLLDSMRGAGHRRARSEVAYGGPAAEGEGKAVTFLPTIQSPGEGDESPLTPSLPAQGQPVPAGGATYPPPAPGLPPIPSLYPQNLPIPAARTSSLSGPMPYTAPSTPQQAGRTHSLHRRNSSSSSLDSIMMGEGVMQAARTPRRSTYASSGSDSLTPGPGNPCGGSPHWTSVKRVHGLTIYHEADGSDADEGGAYMVSLAVRADPDTAFRAVMDASTHRNAPHLPLVNLKLERTIDAQSQVFRGEMAAEPLAAAVSGKRVVTVERTWRHDDDGTYVVLFSSVSEDDDTWQGVQQTKASADDAPAAREPSEAAVGRKGRGAGGAGALAPWPLSAVLGWLHRPVPAKVHSAGYTIAPLQPRYRTGSGSNSQECLVTLVLKIDLGGWLADIAPGCALPRRVLGLARAYAGRAWVEPALLSVLALRDKVEQDRFVVRPFRDDGGARMAAAAAAVAAAAQFNRTTTQVLTGMKHSTRHSRQASQMSIPTTGSPLASLNSSFSVVSRAEDRPESPVPVNLAADGVAAKLAQSPAAAAAASLEAAWSKQQAEAARRLAEAFEADCSCPRHFWSDPGPATYVIRGKNYLKDHKKFPADQPALKLVGIDMFRLKRHTRHIARYMPWLKDCPHPLTIVMNLMVPANPPTSLVASWSLQDPMELEKPSTPWGRLLKKFVDESTPDSWRHGVFKLIPNIPTGSWVIRQAVGSTPVILGRKLKQVYYRGPNYFEIDVDITTSSAAATATRMVHGATKSLIVDMAVLLEGQSEAELPEKLLGSLRLTQLDITKAKDLDTGAPDPMEADSYVKNPVKVAPPAMPLPPSTKESTLESAADVGEPVTPKT